LRAVMRDLQTAGKMEISSAEQWAGRWAALRAAK
jgi:hypothetical protein